MGRWLRKDPDRRYFRYTAVLAARRDMVEVSEEEALGKPNRADEAPPVSNPKEAGDVGAEHPSDLADYIDGLDQEALDRFATERIGERPKHNMSLHNQRAWVKQKIGVETPQQPAR